MYQAGNSNVITFSHLWNVRSHVLPRNVDCLLFLCSQKRLSILQTWVLIWEENNKLKKIDRVRSLHWAVDMPCLLAWGQSELGCGQAWHAFTVQLRSYPDVIYCIYSNGQSGVLIDW